jgi:adenine-specific DNA-methyltransferase
LTEEQKKEYRLTDENGQYRLLGLRLRGGRCTAAESPTLHFPIYYDIRKDDFFLERKSEDDYEIIPKFEDGTLGTWRWSKKKIIAEKNLLTVKPVKDRYDVFTKDYLSPEKRMKLKSLWYEKEINYDNSAKELNLLNMGEIFDYAKPLFLLKKIVNTTANNNSIILDFFSGSATTAHAVMQLNSEDGGNRKFIMVQLPEETDKNSEAYKAGYKNICEIGKERIRRAGERILAERKFENLVDNIVPVTIDKYMTKIPVEQILSDNTLKETLDTGFRVLKVDSTNMKDVYYNPIEYTQEMIGELENNIKNDRTPEDLLFQVMLDLGVLLSSDIKEKEISGKKVFSVMDNYLIACFDNNVSNEVVTEIAKLQPYYAVFRDSSISSDSVATNFEQIFETYSKTTVRKVL